MKPYSFSSRVFSADFLSINYKWCEIPASGIKKKKCFLNVMLLVKHSEFGLKLDSKLNSSLLICSVGGKSGQWDKKNILLWSASLSDIGRSHKRMKKSVETQLQTLFGFIALIGTAYKKSAYMMCVCGLWPQNLTWERKVLTFGKEISSSQPPTHKYSVCSSCLLICFFPLQIHVSSLIFYLALQCIPANEISILGCC